jgi:hypothetical protein
MPCARLGFVSWVCGLVLAVALSGWAAETEILYLTGHGKDDPVKWDFMCSAGQNANKWSTIAVPSNWELQGFGIYTYGRENHNPWPKVQGKVEKVEMLGHAGNLQFTQDAEGLKVKFPAEKSCDYAYVLKITGLKLK